MLRVVFPCHMKSSKAQKRSIPLATCESAPSPASSSPVPSVPTATTGLAESLGGGQVGSSKGRCRVDKGDVD